MKKLIFILTIAILAFTSCTDNTRARKYGGTEEVTLESNEKFINITWKDDDLWIIVQDTTTGDYKAKEKSSWGVWEGQIIVHNGKYVSPFTDWIEWKDTTIKHW